MWKIAGIAFTIAFLAVVLLTEVLRAVVDKRRRVRDGLGGTQDIAIVGTFAMIGCGVAAGVCWIMWFLAR